MSEFTRVPSAKRLRSLQNELNVEYNTIGEDVYKLILDEINSSPLVGSWSIKVSNCNTDEAKHILDSLGYDYNIEETILYEVYEITFTT